MYCRINRQNWSYSDGGLANSKEQQLLRHHAIVMFVSHNLIQIYQKGLNLDLLSKVRMQWNYNDCTLIWIYQKQLNMANSTSRGGRDLKKVENLSPRGGYLFYLAYSYSANYKYAPYYYYYFFFLKRKIK